MTTSFNPDYYPTPDHLIEKMMKKVESRWGVPLLNNFQQTLMISHIQ